MGSDDDCGDHAGRQPSGEGVEDNGLSADVVIDGWRANNVPSRLTPRSWTSRSRYGEIKLAAARQQPVWRTMSRRSVGN